MSDPDQKYYAVYKFAIGWLADTCAGGTFSWNVDDAAWYKNHLEVYGSLEAAEIDTKNMVIVRVK